MRRDAEPYRCQWCQAVLNDTTASHTAWQCRRCKGWTYNPAKLAYTTTEKTPAQTVAAIVEVFAKFRHLVLSYGFASNAETGELGVEWVVRTRRAHEVPDPDAPTDKQPATKILWQDGGLAMRFVMQSGRDERLTAQRWRLVLNYVSNTLNAIAIGAIRAEEAFLAFAVTQLPNGESRTLGEMFEERMQIGEVTLPMFGGGRLEIKALPAPEESR